MDYVKCLGDFLRDSLRCVMCQLEKTLAFCKSEIFQFKMKWFASGDSSPGDCKVCLCQRVISSTRACLGSITVAGNEETSVSVPNSPVTFHVT